MTDGARSLRIVIAGGGTGGHLYPGIAVAREVLRRDPGAHVSFTGTARGIEATIVPREGFEVDLIRSSGLKGKSIANRAKGLALVPLSLLDAWRLLSRRAPDAVVGVGGYSAGPVVLIAALRRIPTLVLEQNAVPGLTNRLLAPFVRAAAVTYDTTVAYFGGRAFVSGNPVRPEFVAAGEAPGDAAPEGPVRVLVFGGSQGAHAINVAMVEAAPRLAAATPRLAITHQTGERDTGMVREAYAKAGMAARVEPFLYAMDREMRDADLVVCRSGATTLAEVTAAGRAAILIPLPTATDNHQLRNAEELHAAGGADLVDQQDLTGPLLAERLLALAADPARRTAMARAARRLARPDAAARIVDRVLVLTKRPTSGAAGS